MAKKPTKRPMGSVRAERAAKRKLRSLEVGTQVAERVERTQTTKGKTRAEYKQRLSKERPGAFSAAVVRPRPQSQWLEAKVGERVEKRVYRFRGPTAFDDAVDVLTELRDDRPRWKVYVQIGEGYHAGAKWVGSRVDTPQEASAWLQGVGTSYLKKGSIFAKKKKAQLWVEIVALRPVKKGARVATVLKGLGELPPKKTKKRRKAKGKK